MTIDKAFILEKLDKFLDELNEADYEDKSYPYRYAIAKGYLEVIKHLIEIGDFE